MRRFRHIFLLRSVLIVLLAWTGADLLVPELCANEGPVPGVTADMHEDHGGQPGIAATAGPATMTARDDQTDRTSRTPLGASDRVAARTRTDDESKPPVPSADDCFCCSQTVQAVTLDLTLGTPSSLPLTDAPAPRFSPGVPREPFHPPLSL